MYCAIYIPQNTHIIQIKVTTHVKITELELIGL